MKRTLLLAIGVICAVVACKKTNNTPPTDPKPIDTDTIPVETKWQIIPIIRTYYGGAVWLKAGDNNIMMLRDITLSNDRGEVFKAAITGKAKGEWVNTDKAKIEKLSDYTYEVTFANCIPHDATAADTTLKANRVYYRVRLAVPSDKVMYIHYAFIDGTVHLSYNGGFTEAIDMNRFLDLTACNTLAVKAN